MLSITRSYTRICIVTHKRTVARAIAGALHAHIRPWLAARVLTQALFGRNGRPITGLAGWSTREVAGRIDRSRAARGVGGTK